MADWKPTKRCKCCKGLADTPMLEAAMISGCCPYCDKWCGGGKHQTVNCRDKGCENPDHGVTYVKDLKPAT